MDSPTLRPLSKIKKYSTVIGAIPPASEAPNGFNVTAPHSESDLSLIQACNVCPLLAMLDCGMIAQQQGLPAVKWAFSLQMKWENFQCLASRQADDLTLLYAAIDDVLPHLPKGRVLVSHRAAA